ncbi:SAV_2336 N-terminal domain-related protein [Actinoallomurus iriomotensis]|uniref:Protein kinase domain-containing protein n=1 Tax=Actinoallomurus iriomotensis TaxID=478107 RepID=A0A9W6S045_9ACTN|nr:SAV_2336 N-terminal domain-related protein [Actinoallomurus iriomotensis]GLY83322.1 hypothetical protein Airi02_012520 [Actinoallomurus iriomotensis]
MNVDGLRTALKGLGPTPSALELAEILWLAAHIAEDRQEASVPAAPATETPLEPKPPAGDDPPPDPEPEPPAAPAAPDSAERQNLRFPEDEEDDGPDPDALVRAVLVQNARMLGRTLEIQRTLRPLKRRVDSRRLVEVDENATADRLARIRDARVPWLPVMVPAQERWLNLLLLVDDGPSMRMWRPLARELHETLARTGAFRDTRVLFLEGASVGASPGSTSRDASTLIDPSGRQVTLVLSDCSGRHWWSGAAQQALLPLAKGGPLAIVQPLAERLWRRTAAPTSVGRLLPSRPCAPNSALTFVSRDGDTGPGPPAVVVPVLDSRPEWLADWARLVGGSGGPQPASVTWFRPGPASAPATPLQRERELTIEERVRRFQSAASQPAVRLAAHVAVSYPALPVMRLIQEAVIGETSPGHLAEVLLSGLLRPREGSTEIYDFVPGARRRLLALLPRSVAWHTAHVLTGLSDAIERGSGTGMDRFRALISAEDGEASQAASPQPFALVNPAALRMIDRRAPATVASPRPDRRSRPAGSRQAGELAGRYRLIEVRGEERDLRVWDALDGADRVMVKEIRGFADSAARATVKRRLEECVAKSRQVGDGVVRYRDVFESDGRIWLVVDGHGGEPLTALLRSGGLAWRFAAEIGRRLVQTLGACAEAGLVHGAITGDDVILTRGGVLLAGFENETINGGPADRSFRDPARPAGEPGSAAGDLWSVAVLLYLMVEGRHPFPPSDEYEYAAASTSRAGPLRVPLQQLLRLRPELRMRLPEVLSILTNLSPEPTEAKTPSRSREPWVSMWGPPGSGKTTYLSALNIALSRSSESWRLVGVDDASTGVIVHTTATLLRDRRFPTGTSSINQLRWMLIGHTQTTTGRFPRRRVIESHQITLNVLDPPGEFLRHGPSAETGKDVFDRLAGSRRVLYLFDPIREFEYGDTFDYLRHMLIHLSTRIRDAGDFAEDGRLPHHLAICVTKFDDRRVFRTAERLGLVSYDPTDRFKFPQVRADDAPLLFDTLCEFSSGNGALIRNLLSTFFVAERVRIFVASGVGFNLSRTAGVFDPDDFENVIPGEEGGFRIRGPIHPIGLLEPLLWLSGAKQ